MEADRLGSKSGTDNSASIGIVERDGVNAIERHDCILSSQLQIDSIPLRIAPIQKPIGLSQTEQPFYYVKIECDILTVFIDTQVHPRVVSTAYLVNVI